jgi:hypothetical protein
MTPKDHPVWNKIAVSTLDTLHEVIIEMRRREKIENWRSTSSLKNVAHFDKDHY